MFGAIARRVFGSANDRIIKGLRKTVAAINALEPTIAELSDEELRGQTDKFRAKLEEGETLDSLLPEAFATVREAAKRTLGQRHYDVQLMGGIILHRGQITEMKTGEGKTLVATLASYLNALPGKGVHVVTVNDYLAKRDSEWMAQVYNFLGLTVGCVVPGTPEEERRAAYAADITYGTNNEFGFDYLRDNMKFELEDMVQRPFSYAIVDEVDSILIDEARTPLIISGPAEDSSEMYVQANAVIPHLAEEHYEIDEKSRAVTLTDAGVEFIEEMLRNQGGMIEGGSLYDIQYVSLVHHLNQALRAHKLFQRDTDYIVKNNAVIIIDEFTGRMMEGRRFSDGLHQALEAKEGVKIQQENQTLASVTFQNYFRLYPKLAGMTGTAQTEAAEFEEIYNLPVVEMPTNVPIARKDYDDEVYRTANEKFEAIVDLLADCEQRGQPVLVGTTSIEKSEMLAEKLRKRGVSPQVLNARYHEQEAFIVSQAGVPGAITIATNMAGRGTDIQLGGNVDMRIALELAEVTDPAERAKREAEIRADVAVLQQRAKEAGGLYVIGTERHESRRIDNQLRGRSGRQGDPGASKFFLSLEDDLMRIFGSERMDGMLQKLGLEEGEAIIHPWINKALEKAQQKVEARNFEIRKNVVKFDNVMNDQRKVIYNQRKELMQANDVAELVTDMRHEVTEDLVAAHIPEKVMPDHWDKEGLIAGVKNVLGLDLPVAEWLEEEGIADKEVLERLIQAGDAHMATKAANYGPETMRMVEKSLVLQVLDQNWKDHLLALDHLRQGIGLRAYGQRDPLNEYKQESFNMFQVMLAQYRERVTTMLARVELRFEDPNAEAAPAGLEAPAEPDRDPNDPSTWGKVTRNAACPCGSGKKYKHCHGQR